MAGGPNDPTSLRSGRRLEDSIYESNHKHNFEGSLMRFTASPLDQITPPSATTTPVVHKDEIVKPFESGSLDQPEAIQSAINMRKAAAAGRRTTKRSEEDPNYIRRHFGNLLSSGHAMKYIPPFEVSPQNASPYNINPLRKAVSDDQINQSYKWRIPKKPPQEVPKHIRMEAIK
ncbi:jg1251 [Pararge aegeria aegeria]|uniref:Jg1251 protein n=1 Tax=Pararge aegeria aegeria TaxID=348720 RepID=A0A8S4RBF1_9NEOP|nr:jg1251 [Pararge aegeria aegeria]